MLYFSKAKLEKIKKKRIAARYSLSAQPTTEEKVRRLFHENKNWIPILRTCIMVAQERGEETRKTENSGRFAGAWVIQALQAEGTPPPNNLRALASIGLITLVSRARSGNRAYYTISDPKGIMRALQPRKQA